MFDWLGLSPAMTQILGIALIVVGAAILLCLGLYLYGKSKEGALNSSTEKSQKQVKKAKAKTAVEETNSAEIKEEKVEEQPVKTQQKKSSNKKTTKPAVENVEDKEAASSVKKQPSPSNLKSFVLILSNSYFEPK